MKKQEFAAEENWTGTYYEVSLELGPVGDDDRALRAIEALWSDPRLKGPWSDRSEFGCAPSPISLAGPMISYYGCLTGPEDAELGCLMWLIRVDDDADYLDLSVPFAMLYRVYSVTYPLDSAMNPWLRQLDEVLVSIAGRVFDTEPFQVGWIGEEAGCVGPPARELTSTDCEQGGILLPEATWRKLEPSTEFVSISKRLVYAPFVGPHITYDG